MSKDTDERKVRQDELRNKRKKLRMGSLAVLLFLLIYIPSLLNWLKGDSIASDILRNGVIEESVNADGVIIRDEILLDAPKSDGIYLPEISEGERVPVSCRVATVLNKKSDELLKELDDINLKIVQAQNEKAKKADFFSEDTAKIDAQIAQKVEDMAALCNTGSLSGLGSLKDDVDGLMEKKAEIAGTVSGDTHISSLKSQRDAIQQRINSNTGQIVSGYSGIISYMIDGYENALTPGTIKDLTPEFIEGIKTGSTAGGYGSNAAAANKPFVKVIRGSDMYIAAVMEESRAARFETGKALGLRINDIGMEMNAIVENIAEKDGKSLVTVKVDRGMNELTGQRKVNVDFISKSVEGLKVPLKCLRDISQDGGSAVIMLIKANCAAKRKVDIIGRDNEYAVIRTPSSELKSTVSLYDTYILNPDNIKEGDIVQNG